MNHFNRLPDSLLVEILALTCTEDLPAVIAACKRFHRLRDEFVPQTMLRSLEQHRFRSSALPRVMDLHRRFFSNQDYTRILMLILQRNSCPTTAVRLLQASVCLLGGSPWKSHAGSVDPEAREILGPRLFLDADLVDDAQSTGEKTNTDTQDDEGQEEEEEEEEEQHAAQDGDHHDLADDDFDQDDDDFFDVDDEFFDDDGLDVIMDDDEDEEDEEDDDVEGQANRPVVFHTLFKRDPKKRMNFPGLFSLLRRKTTSKQILAGKEVALGVLWCTALNEEDRAQIERCGGHAYIVDVLRDPRASSSTMEVVASAMVNLALSDEPSRLLEKLGCVELLVDLLRNGTRLAQEKCAVALGNMGQVESIACRLATPETLALLRHRIEYGQTKLIVEESICTLWNVVYCNTLAEKVAQAGFLPLLVKMLGKSDDEVTLSTREAAAAALCNYACTVHDMNPLIQLGACEALCECILDAAHNDFYIVAQGENPLPATYKAYQDGFDYVEAKSALGGKVYLQKGGEVIDRVLGTIENLLRVQAHSLHTFYNRYPDVFRALSSILNEPRLPLQLIERTCRLVCWFLNVVRARQNEHLKTVLLPVARQLTQTVKSPIVGQMMSGLERTVNGNVPFPTYLRE